MKSATYLITQIRGRRGEAQQSERLDSQAGGVIVDGGSGTGAPAPSGTLTTAKAIETRDTDPSGVDLFEGRIWWRKAADLVLKFYNGTTSRIFVFTAQASGILLALTELDWGTRTEKGDALVTGVGPGFVPVWAAQYATIEIVLDAGGTILAPGIKMDLAVDFACDVVSWAIFADVSSTARVDLWLDSYANFPPTVADTMPNSNATKPQTAATLKGTGSASTWTKKVIAAGDIIRVNLDNNDAATHITVALKVRRS